MYNVTGRESNHVGDMVTAATSKAEKHLHVESTKKKDSTPSTGPRCGDPG
jgi:hypothetical protein